MVGTGKEWPKRVRTDKNGTEIASFTNGSPQLDRAFSIVPMNDGYAIGGMSGKDREHSFPFVARVSRDGNEMWCREIADAGVGVVHDLHAGPNDTLIAIGYAQLPDRTESDGMIVRLSANGDVISRRIFGSATADRTLHARAYEDGSSVIVGYTQRAGRGNPDDR